MTVNNTKNTNSGERESWGTRGFTAAGVQRSKGFKIMISEHLSDAEYEILELPIEYREKMEYSIHMLKDMGD